MAVDDNLLLVEDDFVLLELVKEYLEEQGYVVTACESFDRASDLLYEKEFALLILDVKILGGNGFALLDSIRQRGVKTPAIFMTSLDSLEDMQKGYASGCDDYIKKPFALAELLLRIQAVLKRVGFDKDAPLILSKDISVDFQTQQIIIYQKRFDLSHKEFALLKIFLQNRGIVLSHEVLFEKLWAWDETPSEMSLRAYIKKLRKLLGSEAITTLRGSGYRFELT